MASEQLAWSGRDWRMPVWLWIGLATMFVSVALIQLWWAISFMAGARGNGSGVASAGILGAGWAALTNGFPIVYCPPVCDEARPLTDIGHVGSIVFGTVVSLANTPIT